MRLGVVLAILAATAWAQEAQSGFELRSTISAEGVYSHELSEEPRNGGPAIGTFRALLYPTIKFNEHWAVSGAIQVHSRPYFPDEFSTQGRGIKTNILQANVSYSQYWSKASLVVRAGQMTSAFGSFLTRYDPAVNPLTGMPPAYGYYYAGVNALGLAGAQVDATVGRFDARLQFTNSSPANPRSVFDRDQYGGWTAGAGYTIRQGLRVGASAYRGPYLHKQHRYNFPGEAPPKTLPATAYGFDAQWGTGAWNFYGEWQHFFMPYVAIPNFIQHTGWVEARRVLNARWYAAARLGYQRNTAYPASQMYEMAAGYRPNVHQLVKVSYTIEQGPAYRGTLGNAIVIELVTTLRPIAKAWR